MTPETLEPGRALVPVRLKDRSPEDVPYPEDVDRLVAAFAARGFSVARADVQWAYAEWSEDYYCAGWMSMTGASDDSLFRACARYFDLPRRAPDTTGDDTDQAGHVATVDPSAFPGLVG